MKPTVDLNNLARLIADVENGIAGLPATGHYGTPDRVVYDNAVVRLCETLRGMGAKVDHRPSWEGSAIKLAGIRSTCTAGVVGAVHNWLAAARKRLP